MSNEKPVGFMTSKGSPGTGSSNEDLLRRITADSKIFGGKPIVRGMRISVELIVGLLAQGASFDELLDDYPDLEEADIRACLAYAHAVISEDRLEAVGVAEK